MTKKELKAKQHINGNRKSANSSINNSLEAFESISIFGKENKIELENILNEINTTLKKSKIETSSSFYFIIK